MDAPIAFFAFRITRAYTIISHAIESLSDVCDGILVYQHDADEEVSATHCHILIISPTIGVEGIKKRILRHVQLSGNKDWSFSQNTTEGWEIYHTYMTKGRLDPVFTNYVSQAIVAEARARWVEPTPVNRVETDDERKEVASGLTLLWINYRDEILANVERMGQSETIESFRAPSIAFWRKRNQGLMPTASTYKRFLVSVFLAYRERKMLPLTNIEVSAVHDSM